MTDITENRRLTMTDITENRRRTLAALRAPMPEGFEWDFAEAYKPKEPKGCGAMGVMRAIGIVELDLIDPCADALDISDSDACAVFAPATDNNLYTQTYPGLRYEDVTPGMVADALERAFAEHPVGEGE